MFTDTQLEQWKLDPNHQGAHSCNGRCALIRRLEAAEALISDTPQYEPEWEVKRQAWRKVCGK